MRPSVWREHATAHLKLPVSYLLPAKLNRGFKIYVVPVSISAEATVGLICAFFDDSDCPLTLWRLLGSDKESLDLMHGLTRKKALVHMFDDHGRELLGYEATIDLPLVAKVRLEHMRYPPWTHDGANLAHEQANEWFCLRTTQDDAEAISVSFEVPLFPEDIFVADLTQQSRVHGAQTGAFTVLERPEPGPFQERDIVRLLQRVFRDQDIYHGPKRHYDNEEIADVVVVTDDLCLLVQAKDSPNTEKTLERSLKRKKLVSMHQLKEGLTQVSGVIGYVRRTQPLLMLVDDEEVSLDLGNRNILSLVIVRELFLDMYLEYSAELLKTFAQIDLPCIALNYGELQQYTTYCPDEEAFLSAYFQVFDTARETRKLPRLRFGVNDVYALQQR